MREGGLAFRALQFVPPSWQNRRFLAIAGAGIVVLLGACFGFGPLVRWRAEKTAEKRGIHVEIGTVWPAFGGVSLRDVRFRATESEWLSGEITRVDVGVGLGLGLRSLRVVGGRIGITGSVDEVSEHARAMNKSSGGERPSEGSASGPEVLVEGLRLGWTGAMGSSSALAIEGVRIERAAADGGVARGAVSIDDVRVDRENLHGKAHAFVARFVRDKVMTRWTEVRLERAEIEVPLERSAPEPPIAKAAPVAPPAPPPAPPPRKGGRSARKTAAAPLPPAIPPPAAPALPARIGSRNGYAEQAVALRDRLARWAAWSAEHIAPDAPVELQGLTIVLTQASQRLNLGPGALRVRHDARGLELDFSPGQSDPNAQGGPSRLISYARIPAAEGEIALHVEGGPVTLASLGVREQDFGLFDVARAKVEAKGDVKLTADASKLLFDGTGRLISLSIVHRALADDPVQGLDLGWRASGAAALDGSLVRLDEGKIELGAIRFEASGGVEQGADFTRIEGHATIPTSDCQRVFESLPQALIPKLRGMKMTGTFGLRSGFELDTRSPNDMQIDWELKNRCHITKAPTDIDVERFTVPFKHVVYDEHNEKVEILTGPGTAQWVPFHVMSPFLEAALTTTEDGGFRAHKGFDKSAIKNSIRDNLRQGRFVRGASTVTMQLAKNLYLEREKNLSRKLQEAVLTTYLEQALTKDEILELYFNVVEFGPMIYGIGPAAEHYFNASPNELSVAQSLFMTSLLPSPKRSYFSPTGQLSKGWTGYLHRVLKIMRDRNKINDAELIDGLSEVLTFGVAKSPRIAPTEDVRRRDGNDATFAPEGP
ncbi:MAG TPA: biosynthetic peptidoglycan transglycosylase [Polyangiaceae bacterium]|nr:biosynthetic peptidoglycan transglycosylase [Polyangiaceae bacterium]